MLATRRLNSEDQTEIPYQYFDGHILKVAKEETFKARIYCPNCRKTGEVICYDRENPARDGKFDREVLWASKGFRPGNYLDGTQQVVCEGCRGPVPV